MIALGSVRSLLPSPSDYRSAARTWRGDLVAGLRTVADYPNLIAGLQRAGMNDTDIRKVLGENILRVWTAVEDGARR